MVRLWCLKKPSLKRLVFGAVIIMVLTALWYHVMRNWAKQDRQLTELTLWYRALTNSHNRGSFISKKGALLNLWGPVSEYGYLSPDDDRVLAQLIWAMEFTDARESDLSSNTNGSGSKVKNILLTDPFSWWNRPNWVDPQILDEAECPFMPGLWGKCVFFESFDNGYSSVDAVVSNNNVNPHITSPSILKFSYQLESPVMFRKKERNQLMATFHRSSDINTPYGKWVYYDPAVKFQDQGKDFSTGKSRMAAIFTSNCYPRNNRLGYIKELQKYTNVDVVGACGQNTCPRYKGKQCFELLNKEYRFYLAFENSNCRDYVTEKLFSNAFENDVIPIVLGAHPQDYQAMCPEKSYIHVEEFPSPEDLARYMKYLAENPQAYNDYFRWKGTGTFLNTLFFCRVCAMTHYADVVPAPERTQIFASGENGLDMMERKMCLPRKQWYWTSLPNVTSPSCWNDGGDDPGDPAAGGKSRPVLTFSIETVLPYIFKLSSKTYFRLGLG